VARLVGEAHDPVDRLFEPTRADVGAGAVARLHQFVVLQLAERPPHRHARQAQRQREVAFAGQRPTDRPPAGADHAGQLVAQLEVDGRRQSLVDPQAPRQLTGGGVDGEGRRLGHEAPQAR
jgi:hypothetical protein